jgi:protein O-mannosyl-transferase
VIDRHNRAWRSILVCALLSLATLATYWPALRNDFARVDDDQYVTSNPHVLTGLKWANVTWAFGTGYASNWHPLTWLSHMADVQMFGLNPAGHHLVNLLFHIANTLLLFLLLRRMTRAVWPSGFVAALFALHPLHVESVAWVAERKDVLSTFFFMLTLLAYSRYVQEQQAPGRATSPAPAASHVSRFTFPVSSLTFYTLALVCYALGLMSKPMLVTLPFVLLLLDLWPIGRLSFPLQHSPTPPRRLLLEKLPFLTLAAASCIVTFLVQQSGHSVSADADLPLESRLANAVASYLKYLGMTIWPANLAVFYPHPDLRYPISTQWPGWQIALAALLLAAVSTQALRWLRREPWFATGWFWFLGTLIPAIGIVQAGGQALADRYTYIPLIGLFISLAWGAAEWAAGSKARHMALAAAGVAVIVASAAVTQHQVRYWRDDLTLFQHALDVTTSNPLAHYMVGSRQASQGKLDEAAQHFRAAIEAYPPYGEAYCSLGLVLAQQGKTEEAVQYYQKAIQAKPWDANSHNVLGAMYWKLGRQSEALDQYNQALRLDPLSPVARYNLGMALLEQGKLDEARNHINEAVRLQPGYAPALVRLGRMLALQGKLAEAEASFAEASRLYPTNAEVHLNLGEVRWKLGRQAEALEQYAESLRLQPNQPLVHDTLGSALLQQGRFADAAIHFAEAARLQPHSTSALTGLGRSLAVQGKLDEALVSLRKVTELCPTNAEAHLTLANTLLAARRTNEAVVAYATAQRLDPELASKNLQTGRTLVGQQQLDAALGSFLAATYLDPNNAAAHESLGFLLAQQGKLDETIRQFEQVAQLRPDAQAWYNLGLACTAQGNIRAALTNYQRALQLKPDWPDALNNLAWLLATQPQADLRNGAEAVRLAEKACQISGGKEARYWGTLDAAYAEVGRFEDAIRTAQKARDLAAAAGQNDLVQAAEQRLVQYRKQEPCRQ